VKLPRVWIGVATIAIFDARLVREGQRSGRGASF
jgi:hypothetical protein